MYFSWWFGHTRFNEVVPRSWRRVKSTRLPKGASTLLLFLATHDWRWGDIAISRSETSMTNFTPDLSDMRSISQTREERNVFQSFWLTTYYKGSLSCRKIVTTYAKLFPTLSFMQAIVWSKSTLDYLVWEVFLNSTSEALTPYYQVCEE